MLKKYHFVLTICLATLLNLAIWLVLYFYIPKTQAYITLEYNIYTGVTLSGEWYKVFYIPASGLIIIIMNAFFARWFTKKHELLLVGFLEISMLIIQLMLAAAAGLILYANIT